MNYFNGMEVVKIPLYKKIPARKHKQKRINKKWNKKYPERIIETRARMKELITIFDKLFVPEELWDTFIKTVKIKP